MIENKSRFGSRYMWVGVGGFWGSRLPTLPTLPSLLVFGFGRVDFIEVGWIGLMCFLEFLAG
jgi:hypothetical protein